MPSLKRDKLLSDTERQRLTERETLDKRTRATNDVRVKRKFHDWLKSTGDVICILDNLPEDQIRDVTNDLQIYLLLNIVEDLLIKRKFYPLEGKENKPDDWQIVIDENTKKPAKNLDIIRSSLLGYHIDILKSFCGNENPISMVEFLERMDENPKWQDRVTDEDRKSINRLKQAREEFYRETGLSPKEVSETPK